MRSIEWPDGRPFALALSHDVDRVAKRGQFPYNLAQALVHGRPQSLWWEAQSLWALLCGDDPYWNFHRIRRLESELGVRSTFFVLNEQGRASPLRPRSMVLFGGRYRLDDGRIQREIRELHAGGWEIGLHGSYFSYRDETLLSREKEQLEAVLGEPIRGSRQHYLNLDIPESWQRQARAGLTYDSTLGFADRVGFRWGTSRPFYPRDPLTGRKLPILQLPLGIMDAPLMQADRPWSQVMALLDLVVGEQGVLTIDWHQRVFNPWEFQAYQDMYVRIVRECQRRGAWIGPLGAVVDQWLKMSRHKE